jgi:hypothetical protein
MKLPELVKSWMSEYRHNLKNKESRTAKHKSRKSHLRNLQRAYNNLLNKKKLELIEENEQLKIDNARMLKALNEIANTTDSDFAGGWVSEYHLRDIARTVLKGK